MITYKNHRDSIRDTDAKRLKYKNTHKHNNPQTNQPHWRGSLQLHIDSHKRDKRTLYADKFYGMMINELCLVWRPSQYIDRCAVYMHMPILLIVTFRGSYIYWFFTRCYKGNSRNWTMQTASYVGYAVLGWVGLGW